MVARHSGAFDRAVPLHQQALAEHEQMLGPDHPDTLSARRHLADAYRITGDPDRAVAEYEQLLLDSVPALGPAHAWTREVRGLLETLYGPG